MAARSSFPNEELGKGVIEINLNNCDEFEDLFKTRMLYFENAIYRGQGDAAWKLEPTLDRILENPNSAKRKDHLNRFQYSTRGRRGPNPAALASEDDWWALGQHHGLATPLLDWTESPYVALYFAASSAFENEFSRMAVWVLSKTAVEQANLAIEANSSIAKINDQMPVVKVFSPLSDENSRLVSQRGLFTRGPNNMDLVTWMKAFYVGDKHGLFKISIPTDGIEDRLRKLNRMNINFASLFPDLTGASDHCNRTLRIDQY